MKQTLLHKAIRSLFIPIGVVLSVPAFAADGRSQTQAQSSKATTQNESASKREQKSARFMRASELLDAKVVDKSGRTIGEIDDFIVNLTSADISYAAVTFEGMDAADGNRIYAVPVRDMRRGGERDKVVLNADVNRVTEMRSWERDNWKNAFQQEGSERGQASAGSSAPALSSKDSLRASKLIGKDIETPQGDDLGQVKDLVIDLDSQKVQYAVISFDPGILQAERNHAIPVQRFMRPKASTERAGEVDKLVLNASKERLKELRGFADDRWPDFNDNRFLTDLNRRFDRWFGDGDASTGPGGATSNRDQR